MLKAVGVLCVLVGTGWWGWKAVDRLKERVRVLEGLEDALTYMAGELSFRLTPVPVLLEELGRSRGGAVGRFFGAALDGLQGDPEAGLRTSWRRAVTNQLSLLRPEEREVVLSLGETLGRYDGAGQARALERAAGRLEELRRGAEEERGRLGRVYATLSVAGGLAAALVLL